MPVTCDLDFMFIDLPKGRTVQMSTSARSSSQQVRGLAQMSESPGSDGLLGQSSIVDKMFQKSGLSEWEALASVCRYDREFGKSDGINCSFIIVVGAKQNYEITT
jgi:hypothetical protein